MEDKNLVINLNKPEGMTSQEAVTEVKRIFSARKAGHAGTLDPMATGLLLVCLNEATKIARFLTDTNKEYIAVMKLGERTDTLDSEGKIIHKTEDISLNEKEIKAVLEKFRGAIKQTPPMYSAIKVSGKPLYKLARRGIEVERAQKDVTIYELEMLNFNPPFLKIRVSCSKGTYIRSLCDDIGMALGVGAYMVALKRTKTGNFRIEDSAEIRQLPDKHEAIFTIDAALSHFKDIFLPEYDFFRAMNGMSISCGDPSLFPENSHLRLKSPEGKLFAIGRATKAYIKVERRLHI
ncbi:MAG: tRNA pseudouridine(55) synthase TruB [Nitrospirae bacterium]|nr:tRNA pseudouridine(55) synthase TruB [Nitrospirota bacterium]